MSEARIEPQSISARTRRFHAGAPVVGLHFIGRTAIAALGEQSLLILADEGEQRVEAHAGAILCSAADERRVVTGGDDGRLMAVGADGMVATIAIDERRRWIDRVAIGPGGALAWSAGKQVFARAGGAEPRVVDAPSSPGGLAFAPKGFRLAIAHYNGASLWFPNAQAAPDVLTWKGSHLLATFSRDGRFLITAMQEPMLHGWRLADRKDMRMSGYSAKAQSMDWSADGRWLATSGSEQLILWPFQSKDGPMGKAPLMLAPYRERVARVACHPKQAIVAAGFNDGLVLLVRLDDGAEVVARRAAGAPVSALAWDASGSLLGFGDEAGEGGVAAL